MARLAAATAYMASLYLIALEVAWPKYYSAQPSLYVEEASWLKPCGLESRETELTSTQE